MNSAELKRAKRAIRVQVLAARDALPVDTRTERSKRIAEVVVAMPQVDRASTVMAFWSFGSEVDTAPLIGRLHDRGLRVALQRIVEAELEARTYAIGDEVTPTAFGAFEPSGGDVIDPASLGTVVTPGVAFDRTGGRIGYGGGFYDRLFLRTRPDALRIGIGFRLQLVEEPLPAGSFDARVDVIVTESETVRCGRVG